MESSQALGYINIAIPECWWYSVVCCGYKRYYVVLYKSQAHYCYFLFSGTRYLEIYASIRVLQFRWEPFISLKSLVTFMSMGSYIPCRKLYYRKKGAWVTYRRQWPYLLTLRMGYGHPVRVNLRSICVRRFKRYVQYSNLLFLSLDEAGLR